MDLSNMTLASEDEKQWNIFDKRDGKTFPIAKTGLSKPLTERLTEWARANPNQAPPEEFQALSGRERFDAMQAANPPKGINLSGIPQAVRDWAHQDAPPSGPVAPVTQSAPAPQAVPVPEPVMTDIAPEGAPAPMSQPMGGVPRGTQMPMMGGGISTAGLTAAYGQAAAAETAKADVQAALAAQAELKAAEKLARDQQVSQVWDAKYQENEGRIQRQQADIASGKVDPDRWWNDVSAGGNLGRKVTASIALMLGGIGEAFGGGPSPALRHINAAIERDIDAQKADLGKKMSLLGQYVQQGHDIQTARQLAIAHSQSVYAAQLERNKFKFGGLEARAAADSAIADLNAKSAQARMAASQQSLQNQLQMLDRMRLEEETQAKLMEKMRERSGIIAPGWGQGPIELSPDEKKKFREGVAVTADMRAKAEELGKLIDTHGTENMPGPIKRQMESLSSELLTTYNSKKAELGALAGHDVGFLEDIIPRPTKTFAPEWVAQNRPKVDALLKSLSQFEQSRAGSMGLGRIQGGMRSEDQQAVAKAREVLKTDPTNKAALYILSRTGGR